MKKVFFLFMMLTAWNFQSCDNAGNNTDTVEQADDINEEKDDADVTNVKEDDSEFMTQAASGGLFEVQAAEWMLQKSASKTVKDFAQAMLTDHSKANEELKALAASKNITIPTAPGEKHMEKLEDLKKLSGTALDEKYMDMMVDDHKEDVDLFEDAADDAKDADIKAWAAKTLPTLKHHLEMAEAKENHTDHAHDKK